MTTIEEKFEKVEYLEENYEYSLAFNLLDEIIEDKKAHEDEIAEALNIKGLIVVYAPYLSEYEEDETGLIYFIKAFDYDPSNISVLSNIIISFDDISLMQEYTRNNKHIFVKAYEILKNDLYDILSQEVKDNLHKFSFKYDSFKEDGF